MQKTWSLKRAALVGALAGAIYGGASFGFSGFHREEVSPAVVLYAAAGEIVGSALAMAALAVIATLVIQRLEKKQK
jgi:hypothetical protein